MDRVADLREWITYGRARDLRVAAGLSQALVAQECGVTASTVHKWEVGMSSPRGRNLVVYHAFLTGLVEREQRGGERGGR